MFTNIGKLLTYGITNPDLYNFGVQATVMINEFMGDNAVLTPYIRGVSDAVDTMEKVFSRNLKNPFTVKIQRKNRERLDLLTALRRSICTAQKMTIDPKKVAAADMLKQQMQDRGWWIYNNLNYAEATVIIRTFVEKSAELPFSGWVKDAGLGPIVDGLWKTQQEFEALSVDRFEQKGKDTTPQLRVARRKLKDVLLSMLAAIDFGMEYDPESFAEIGSYISEMITETNALTRGSQTRAKNSGVDEYENSEVGEQGTEKEEADVEWGSEVVVLSGRSANDEANLQATG